MGFFTAFRMTYKEKYVILSVSEISHRTIALLVVIARHEVPIGDFTSY